jgi:hypothetical protein
MVIGSVLRLGAISRPFDLTSLRWPQAQYAMSNYEPGDDPQRALVVCGH